MRAFRPESATGPRPARLRAWRTLLRATIALVFLIPWTTAAGGLTTAGQPRRAPSSGVLSGVAETPPSVTSATAIPSNPTVGQTVSFSCSASPGSAPISSYRWTFGDGGSATTAQATHAYASNGTYTATCTVTDTASRTGSRSAYVTVGGGGGSCTLTGFDWDLYDVASGTQIVPFGGYFDVSSGQALRFQGASSSVPSSGVTWSFGDGGTCSTNPCNHAYTYTGTGSKPYTVSLSYGSCSASHVVYVTGATPPPAQLSFTVVDAVTQIVLPKDQFNMSEATSGQRLKFKPVNHSGAVSWNFGDGTTSAETEPEHTFNTAVDAQFRVVLTNGTKTAQQWISVLGSSGVPLTGNFTVRYADNTAINTGAVQPNKAIKFTSLDSADSYLWDFGDGTPLASGSPVLHTYTRGGIFAVKVTVGRAGVEPVTTPNPVILTVLAPTTLDFEVLDAATQIPLPRDQFNNSEAASGQRLVFTPSGHSGAVSWDFGDGTTSSDTEPEHTYHSTTDQNFLVTLSNGTKTKQRYVSVIGSSGAPLTGRFTLRYTDDTPVETSAVQPNKLIRFTSLDTADTYRWNFGDGTPAGSGSPVEHAYTRTGTFPVTVTVNRAGVPSVTTPNPVLLTVVSEPQPSLWLQGGMAYSDGNGGTFWQSDLVLFNPSSSATMRLSLSYLDGRTDPNPDALTWVSISLDPLETQSWANVVSDLFYQERGSYGGILVRGEDVPLDPVIRGRTYNSREGEGTFGLSVPSVRVSDGITPAAGTGSNILIGLRHTPPPAGAPPSGSRTNLALANLRREPAHVRLRFHDAAGSEIGQPVEVNLAPYRIVQIANVLSASPPEGAGYASPSESFVITVDVLSGNGVFPYATVIDNQSGDAIVVVPAENPAPTYRLPGVIRARGNGGTVWRSDVSLFNPGPTTRSVSLTYSYAGDDGRRNSGSDVFDVVPGQSLGWIDFVEFWLRLPAGDDANYTDAFIDLTPSMSDGAPTEPLLLVGKTYNDQPTGEIGLQVDAFTSEAGITATSASRRLVLAGLTSDTSYRSNVILFLATTAPTTSTSATVRILDSIGRELKRTSETLHSASRPIIQLNDGLLFGDVPGDRRNLTVVVEGVTGSVPVAAYATVIDQISGDATFIVGQQRP